jgi:hypothetical protein
MNRRIIALSCLVVLVSAVGLPRAGPPPPCAETLVESPADLIAVFAHAYRSMDLELYRTLFAHEPGQGVGFRFVLHRPTAAGESEWGYDEEIRIHRRMFEPESIGPTEKPLPRELWIRSISVQLLPLTDFRQRYDLYISEHNPMGELDRKKWRATDAVYATCVTWFTEAGQTMQINGQARFIVIEDLQAEAVAARKFWIYRWEDLGAGEVGVAQCQP